MFTPTDSLTYIAVTSAGQSPSYNRLAKLSDTTAVLAFQNNLNDETPGLGILHLVRIENDKIDIVDWQELGEESPVRHDLISIAALNSTMFVVAYQCLDTMAGEIMLWRAEGDRLEILDIARFGTDEVTDISVVAANPELVMLTYRQKDYDTCNPGQVVVWTVHNDRLFVQTSHPFAENPICMTATALEARHDLENGRILVCYQQGGKGIAQVIRWTPAKLDIGKPRQWEDAPVSFISTHVLEDGHVVIGYRRDNENDEGIGYSNMLYVTGPSVSPGTPYVIHEKASMRHSSLVSTKEGMWMWYGDNVGRTGNAVKMNGQKPESYQKVIPTHEMYDFSTVSMGNQILLAYRQGMMKEDAHGILTLWTHQS